MDTIRVGVIGIGNMGSAHAACVFSGKIQGLSLYAVCDIVPERLAYCESHYPGVLCYGDWRELLKDPQVDAVIMRSGCRIAEIRFQLDVLPWLYPVG